MMMINTLWYVWYTWGMNFFFGNLVGALIKLYRFFGFHVVVTVFINFFKSRNFLDFSCRSRCDSLQSDVSKKFACLGRQKRVLIIYQRITEGSLMYLNANDSSFCYFLLKEIIDYGVHDTIHFYGVTTPSNSRSYRKTLNWNFDTGKMTLIIQY